MTYDATILAESSLVNYFKLGEAVSSSSVADSKGTAVGTVGTGVTLGNTGGVNDSSTCAYFPGANTTETITINQMLGPTGNSLTQNRSVEWWVNTPARAAAGNNNGMICLGISNNYFDLWANGSTSSNWEFGMYDPDFGNVSGGGTLLENTWYHVVYTFTAGCLIIYVNGYYYYQCGTYLNSTPAGNSRFGQGYAGDMSNCYMQKIAVYNAALTQAQVQTHYSAGGGTPIIYTYRAAYNALGNATPIKRSIKNTSTTDKFFTPVQRVVKASYNVQSPSVTPIQRTVHTGLPGGGGAPRPLSGQLWPRGVPSR